MTRTVGVIAGDGDEFHAVPESTSLPDATPDDPRHAELASGRRGKDGAPAHCGGAANVILTLAAGVIPWSTPFPAWTPATNSRRARTSHAMS